MKVEKVLFPRVQSVIKLFFDVQKSFSILCRAFLSLTQAKFIYGCLNFITSVCISGWLISFIFREKDVDIAFAQDAIDEFKVKNLSNYIMLFFFLYHSFHILCILFGNDHDFAKCCL